MIEHSVKLPYYNNKNKTEAIDKKVKHSKKKFIKMDGIFIFDGSNDLIFEKLNGQIKEKLLDLAQKQGLLEQVSFHRPKHYHKMIIHLYFLFLFSRLMLRRI